MTINRRIKLLREELNMTQNDFSRVLCLSSGYLAGVETEKRKANGRIIKLICSSFNVSEHWLRTGDGSMFLSGPDETFVRVASLFKELTPEYREYVFKEIKMLLELQDKLGSV
jgi:transcriptional regulator with XRE-family HTH domain